MAKKGSRRLGKTATGVQQRRSSRLNKKENSTCESQPSTKTAQAKVQNIATTISPESSSEPKEKIGKGRKRNSERSYSYANKLRTTATRKRRFDKKNGSYPSPRLSELQPKRQRIITRDPNICKNSSRQNQNERGLQNSYTSSGKYRAKKRQRLSSDTDSEFQTNSESESNAMSKRQEGNRIGENRYNLLKNMYTPTFPKERQLERILGTRLCKESNVEEYLVKWKGYSYIHVEWKSASDLKKIDARSSGRILKYEQTLDRESENGEEDNSNNVEEEEAEYFNPEYTNIDHILGEYVHSTEEFGKTPFPEYAFEDTGELINSTHWHHRYYLIKWCMLSYAEITWEPACALPSYVFQGKLKLFYEHNKIPDSKMRKKFAPLGKMLFHTLNGDNRQKSFKRLTNSHEYGKNKFTLREYQLEGVNWLLWNWCRGQKGSLLGDEMGLGKTIQCLCMIDELSRTTTMPSLNGEYTLSRGPHLIVVPLSCILQWQREIEAWTSLNCIIYHGDETSRSTIRKYHFHYRNGVDSKTYDKNLPIGKILCTDYFRFNVLITTYEILVRDSNILGRIGWHCLVVDEAHRLKNKESKLSRELTKLKREYCVLLTGTPIQNNVQELWCLLNFIVGDELQQQKRNDRSKKKARKKSNESPKWFSTSMESQFMKKFGTVTNHKQVNQLHNLLRPFLLRRVKEDVERSLPPKVETIIEIELTVEQKKLYRAIYEKNKAFLFRGGKASNGPSLMNIMMELRKCCNHPFLIRGTEDRIKDEIRQEQKNVEAEINNRLITLSGKLILLDKLLQKLANSDHRVLVFSQMVRMLDIIEDYLVCKGISFERLDGTVTGADRQAAIDRFSRIDSHSFVMLLSTRAGGLGLNLSCADTVIIYDSDWNPQNDLQAQARSHRIGQTRSVKVFRLVTRKTYEMSMFERASIKLGLDRALLNDQIEKFDPKKKLSAREINDVLKHGAYALFEEKYDKSLQDSKHFEEASIDQILKEQSREVEYKPQKNALSGNFSKASFISEETGVKIDINDPEFWAKVAGFNEENVDCDSEPFQNGGLSKSNIVDANTVRQRRAVLRMGMTEESSQALSAKKPQENGEPKMIQKKKKRKKKQKKKKVRQAKFRAWTDKSRDDIVDGLLCYGWGQWDLILATSNLKTYGGVARLEIFCCYLLTQVYRSYRAKSRWDSVLKKLSRPLYTHCKQRLSEVDTESELDQAEMVLSKASFLQRLKAGTSQKILERIELLHRIRGMYDDARKKAYKEITAKCVCESCPLPDNLMQTRKDALFEYQLSYKGGLCGMTLGLYYDDDTDTNLWYIKDIVKGGILDASNFCKKYDVVSKINGRDTSRVSSLVEIIDLLFEPLQRENLVRPREILEKQEGNSSESNSDSDPYDGSQEEESVNSSNKEDNYTEIDSGWKLIEFIRCKTAYGLLCEEEKCVDPSTSDTNANSYEFKVSISRIHPESEDISSWTDAQASRALVSVIDSCKQTAPISHFLVSKCRFNNDRATKVINGAVLLKQHEKAACPKRKKLRLAESNLPRRSVKYSEQIQNKVGWERLKTELISRKIFRSHKIRSIDHSSKTMFVREGLNKYYYWNRQLDIHLIVGIAKHGMWKPNTSKPGLAFEQIASDPSLAFAKIIGYEHAVLMFEAKKKHMKIIEKSKNLRAKEARRKYMARKKGEINGKVSHLKDDSKADYKATFIDENGDTKVPVDGPSMHLPKCRVVERYLMTLLIREYETESGLILKDKSPEGRLSSQGEFGD